MKKMSAVASTVLFLLAVSAACGAWIYNTRRAATVSLEGTGYELRYTMAWGWGMEQKLDVARVRAWRPQTSSAWIETWKRPYNSGAAVYRSEDGNTFYLGTIYNLMVFHPKEGHLLEIYSQDGVPERTTLGTMIKSAASYDTKKSIDPAAQHLFRYVEPEQRTGPIPSDPPMSKYYTGLRYLGRFGLLRAPWRGGPPQFVPAGEEAEPQLALEFSRG
jgi:hypothetical protein